mgnify:FL=1
MGSNTSPPLGHFSMQQLHQLSLEYLSMPVGLCQSSICWTYCNPALKRHLQDQDDLAGSLGLSAEVWQQVWRCITRHRQYHALNLVLPALLAQYVLVSRRLDDAGETPSYLIEFQNKSNIFQQVWQHSLGANLQQQQQRQALKMAQQMHSALHLSNTDSLTDIANRRAFDQHFAQLWQQTTSIEEPLSLMLIDIDFLKISMTAWDMIMGIGCCMKWHNAWPMGSIAVKIWWHGLAGKSLPSFCPTPILRVYKSLRSICCSGFARLICPTLPPKRHLW